MIVPSFLCFCWFMYIKLKVDTSKYDSAHGVAPDNFTRWTQQYTSVYWNDARFKSYNLIYLVFKYKQKVKVYNSCR